MPVLDLVPGGSQVKYCPMHMARILDAFLEEDVDFIKAQADECDECLDARAR